MTLALDGHGSPLVNSSDKTHAFANMLRKIGDKCFVGRHNRVHTPVKASEIPTDR
jgi:hypothetical protein